MKKTHNAFTLAEISVALIILGVVAVIALQNISLSIKKQQILTGIKTSYSILSNAVRMSEAYNGPVSGWGIGQRDTGGRFLNTDDCCGVTQATAFAERYLVPFLNINYFCKYSSNNTAQNICFRKDRQDRTNNFYGISGLELNTYNGGNGSYMFLLKNGMSVAVKKYQLNSSVRVAFDINGPNKGRSRAGEDVFIFEITNDPKIGVRPLTIGTGNYCSGGNVGSGAQSSGGAGATCAAYIINNNWKFPSDYPFKFNPKNYWNAIGVRDPEDPTKITWSYLRCNEKDSLCTPKSN